MQNPERPDWLDDPGAPATPEEIAESERLRDALSSNDGAAPERGHPLADFARSVALAVSPKHIQATEHEAIVKRAVQEHRKRRRRDVVRLVFGVSTLMAAAAAVAIWVHTEQKRDLQSRVATGHAPAGGQLQITRSTQALFTAPFATTGGETARIDRIAMARAGDLRENQFARWGVR
jgi:hypothetical protein